MNGYAGQQSIQMKSASYYCKTKIEQKESAVPVPKPLPERKGLQNILSKIGDKGVIKQERTRARSKLARNESCPRTQSKQKYTHQSSLVSTLKSLKEAVAKKSNQNQLEELNHKEESK